MKLDIVNEQHGITKLVLAGSMDIQGALEVDPQFNEILKTKDKVIVDLRADPGSS
jgi:hypothetical protein